jgi:hypothetical protein
MTCPFSRLRRFRFSLPQRIAAVLLALFLAQGLWLIGHQPLTPQPSGACRGVHDGILACRLAGVPLALSFLAAGCLLGGGLWWVTRRLYGNLGGYTALALYCFSPVALKSCIAPNPEVLAALGVYGGVYTCIGVAHAMQGPRRKWRPRIVLLMVAFGLAAASQIAALPVVALLGLAFMLWVAEGRRRQVLPVVLLAAATAFPRRPSVNFSVQRRTFRSFRWNRRGGSSPRRATPGLRLPRLPLSRSILRSAGRATSAIPRRCFALWA